MSRRLAVIAVLSFLGPTFALGADPPGTAAHTSADRVYGDKTASQHFGGQAFDIPDPAHGGRGGRIYIDHCARCHDKGLEFAPQRYIFVYMSPQSIYRTLKSGAMQAQGMGLTDQDKIAVAEFITRQKMSTSVEAPEPPPCGKKTVKFDFDEPPVFPGWGLTRSNTRFVATDLAGIDKANVGRLHLAWAVAFPNAIQARSEPGLAGGAVYVGSQNGEVYSLDRASGCVRWKYQAGSEVRTAIIVSPWKAGDHRAKPLLYFGDITGIVYAVDAQTGRLVWRARPDSHPNITITGAPTLYDGVLYVPVSTAEGGRAIDPTYACCISRGSVVAYDAISGAVKWKTYTTAPPKLVGLNAKGAQVYAPSGASVWNSPTIDPARKQLYVGTAENSTSPATATSDAMIAMDLETGAIKWVYQGYAGDAFNAACFSADKTSCPVQNGPDFDFGGASAMLLATADGRELLIAGQKSGVVHALDPGTGKLIWKSQIGRGGMLGGVHFGMAANKQYVFVPINDAPDGRRYREPPRPGVYALDPANGEVVWSAPANQDVCSVVKNCLVGYSQAITATADLVFAGDNEGWLRAFDAQSGEVLWKVNTRTPVRTVNDESKGGGSFGGGAGPVPYHGMLFVSSGYANAGRIPGNLLLAFTVK